ncbi:hypothetical protein JCM5353_005033 [Sporobolomyces roseus]
MDWGVPTTRTDDSERSQPPHMQGETSGGGDSWGTSGGGTSGNSSSGGGWGEGGGGGGNNSSYDNNNGEDSGEPRTVFVGQLSWNVDNDWLESEFSECGTVVSARVVLDRETGRSRGFGYVEFATSEEATKALESNGKDVDGRNIKVDLSLPRPPRGEGGGGERGGRSGGGGGGRGGFAGSGDKNETGFNPFDRSGDDTSGGNDAGYGGRLGPGVSRPSRGGFDGGRSGGFDTPPQRDRGPFMAELSPPDWDSMQLPEFQRDFYKEHANVAARTQEEVDEWREKHKVTVRDGEAPKPVLTWGETKLPKYLLEDYVVEKGYPAPTSVQSQAIPMALSGKDLVAISETGSGKTLAYAAPAMVHIAAQPPSERGDGPIALILAPTRELATQILRECRALSRGGEIKSACAYGGVSRTTQMMEIQSGVDILIATPGRLLDFLSAREVTLKRCTYFVLDEADRMVHLGFENEVRQIISMIRPDRQTLMFSATFERAVRDIAQEFYRDAVTVHIGLDVLNACSNIEQRVEITNNYTHKLERLVEILVDEVAPIDGKALIFVNKKSSAVEVTDFLRSKSIEAISLHGDKRQEERDFALSEFRANTIPVLVGTDVCQRGLDIPQVSIVINFDAPQDAESYVHRIGRTGRAGNKGKALTFFGFRDGDVASKIIEVLAANDVEVPEDLQDLAKGSSYSSLPDSASPEFEDPSSSNPADAPAWGAAASAWGASEEPSTEGGEGSESGETVRQSGGAEDSGYLSPGGSGGGGGKDAELESWKNEEELSEGVKGLGVGGGKAQSGW